MFPAGLKSHGSYLAEVMDPTVDVAVLVFVIMRNPVDDTLRLLGCGRIIKVYQRFIMYLFPKDRESGAHFVNIKCHDEELFLAKIRLFPGTIARFFLVVI
jgi:hypothetical protein